MRSELSNLLHPQPLDICSYSSLSSLNFRQESDEKGEQQLTQYQSNQILHLFNMWKNMSAQGTSLSKNKNQLQYACSENEEGETIPISQLGCEHSLSDFDTFCVWIRSEICKNSFQPSSKRMRSPNYEDERVKKHRTPSSPYFIELISTIHQYTFPNKVPPLRIKINGKAPMRTEILMEVIQHKNLVQLVKERGSSLEFRWEHQLSRKILETENEEVVFEGFKFIPGEDRQKLSGQNFYLKFTWMTCDSNQVLSSIQTDKIWLFTRKEQRIFPQSPGKCGELEVFPKSAPPDTSLDIQLPFPVQGEKVEVWFGQRKVAGVTVFRPKEISVKVPSNCGRNVKVKVIVTTARWTSCETDFEIE